MSDNTIRIKTDLNQLTSKHLKVKIDQDFDFLEILSLSISQEEVYRRFCSDYGVVVGRAIMNNGVGIPNAKVSIFIPIDDDDKENVEISSLYPFERVGDKDSDGKRYNLLPNTSQFECHTIVGALASKREILDNDLKLDIHCKYYKYTAITNAAGDFMIFGVPVGTHFINVDCDLSDIGIYSQRPYDFMSLGQPKKAFTSPTKFKGGDDLDKLNQIKNRQSSVNVRPFWGDEDQCSVGITRIDIDLKYDLKPSAIFIGNIFGDNEKNSLNKKCNPRKKLGKICENITTEGSINMLRRTLGGNNERFDIDGGRVIDENGAWAFQVPMNLDYMVSNEVGDLVPSLDPTKGIPTKSSVRFKIGMDVTGDEKRLRTRAKYLVPHNPDTYSDSDYTFDDSTDSKHFKDMFWNKIYSVKNFIPRYQPRNEVGTRSSTGIKDVDDCTGTHNPFPFNRVDIDINPLFSIMCIIMTVLVLVVVIINTVVLTIINTVILIINGILGLLCTAMAFISTIACGLKHLTSGSKRKKCRCDSCIGDCDDSDGKCHCFPSDGILPYVPCIVLDCEGEGYGVGCVQGGLPLAWSATKQPPMKHWPGSNADNGYGETIPPGDAGWTSCQTLKLVESLNMFEFDFYNDWINGSLYSFLLKYKKKKNDKEKFCEYDCDDFGGGVDKNDDGKSDNKCKNNYLLDTCVKDGVKNRAENRDYVQIRDGLIKSVDDELFYASYTHDGDYKLFATDIINLGAVFDCDWQGSPKIQQQLTPTSYNAPPLINEVDDDGKIVVSGYDSPNISLSDSLFFEVNCAGIFTEARTCQNISRQCEIGVGLDEDRTDEIPTIGCVGQSHPLGHDTVTGGGGGEPDGWVDNCDIDNLFIRDIFTLLNQPSSTIDLLDTTTVNKHALFNSTAYDEFRDVSNQAVNQPRGGSYFFYFGIKPGQTAIELMNSKFFSDCEVIRENEFQITGVIIDATSSTSTDGSIDVTVFGGTGPYTYLWSNGATTEDLNNVSAGTYTVIVTDSNGYTAQNTFNVGKPFPITCDATPSPTTTNTSNDGSIQIVSIGGGSGPYTVSISGPMNVTHTNITGPTDSFTGLQGGTYTTTITDTLGETCIQTNIEVLSPPELTMAITSTQNISCFEDFDGKINFNYVTGVIPVTASVTGPNGYTSSSFNLTGLFVGTYNITLTDSIGQTVSDSVTLTQPPIITAVMTELDISCFGEDDGILLITPSGGVSPYTYEWEGPTPDIITSTSNTLITIGTSTLPIGVYTVIVTDANGCHLPFNGTIQEPPEIAISQSSKTNVTCDGGSDGQIVVIGSGGQPAIGNGVYEYRRNGGSWQTSGTFSVLSEGTHTMEVRDERACTDSMNISLTEPSAVDLTNGSKTDTTITVNSATGGNGGTYQYKIRTTDTGSGSGAWSGYQTSTTFSSLASSTSYDMQAKDSKGCFSNVISETTDAPP